MWFTVSQEEHMMTSKVTAATGPILTSVKHFYCVSIYLLLFQKQPNCSLNDITWNAQKL